MCLEVLMLMSGSFLLTSAAHGCSTGGEGPPLGVAMGVLGSCASPAQVLCYAHPSGFLLPQGLYQLPAVKPFICEG